MFDYFSIVFAIELIEFGILFPLYTLPDGLTSKSLIIDTKPPLLPLLLPLTSGYFEVIGGG